MIRVLKLATSKGGAGKSTLARSLAAHWLMVGHKPALVDADPQRSLADRHDPAGKLGAIELVAEPEERIAEVIEELRRKHAPVIVDTAGFRNRTTICALVASDLAVIPLKPSAEDVDAAIATYELIQEINETPEREGSPIVTAVHGPPCGSADEVEDVGPEGWGRVLLLCVIMVLRLVRRPTVSAGSR
jgi:chromosome partitioning protein